MEAALAAWLGSPVQLHAAGRTDAGVDAAAQVVSFSVRRVLTAIELTALALPADVELLAAAAAHPSFHARASAVGKRYRYRFAWGASAEPAGAFWLGSACEPDWERARQALQCLSELPQLPGLASPSRTRAPAPGLTAWRLEELRTVGGPQVAELTLEAPAFRKHQVRNLAGHLAAVALSLAEPQSLRTLAASRRPWCGATAPAHGLTLLEVIYPRGLDPFA